MYKLSFPLELYPLCVKILWLSCVCIIASCQFGPLRWTVRASDRASVLWLCLLCYVCCPLWELCRIKASNIGFFWTVNLSLIWFPLYVSVYIQDESGRICNTLGNDSMCDSKQKHSYEQGSDFERLPRYGKKKIRTILRARTAIT